MASTVQIEQLAGATGVVFKYHRNTATTTVAPVSTQRELRSLWPLHSEERSSIPKRPYPQRQCTLGLHDYSQTWRVMRITWKSLKKKKNKTLQPHPRLNHSVGKGDENETQACIVLKLPKWF